MMVDIIKTQTGTFYSEKEGVEYNECPPPDKLVKVMKKRWAEELRLKGAIRFGNLEEYRNWENPILGDKNDGQGMYVMNGDEYHTDSMSEIYAWCASLPGISHRRILDIAKSNNYDCVVEIKSARKFIERISKSMDSEYRGNFALHLHCGKVQYDRGSKVSKKKLNDRKFHFNVFQKSNRFRKDKEYRLSLTRAPIIPCTRTGPLEPSYGKCICLNIGDCSDIINIKKLPSTNKKCSFTAIALLCLFLFTPLAGLAAEPPAVASLSAWDAWGGDAQGRRYAPVDQITPDNVSRLEVAWEYSTGELTRRSASMLSNSTAETTPILVAGSLVSCTPFGRVIALDPVTGAERWVFDPGIDPDFQLPNQYICRGVAQWRRAGGDADALCATRVIYTTVDMRLFAIDARRGLPCPGFGEGGVVRLQSAAPPQHLGEVKPASPPTVVNDTIAVGSMILDNVRANAPRGVVYGYDALSGEQRWAFDPIPQDAGPTEADWLGDSRSRTGAANMWSVMSADPQRDLLFVPTSSAAPDYYGGERRGDNRYANSLVALNASSGALVWSYQFVHHDVWDYDTPAQPTLVDISRDGATVPAVVQVTKQALLFVFDRRDGTPLFPIDETPVPQGAVAGERLSPTQPIPTLPEPLFNTSLKLADLFGFTFWDRRKCRKRFKRARYDGLYTPPSLQGSIHYPGAAGGANWGGAAVDPTAQTLFINSTRVASLITLIPRRATAGDSVTLSAVADVSPMKGTPFEVRREFFLSPWGAPCTPPPWGGLTAYDLASGQQRWDVPLGTINHKLPIVLPFDVSLGTPNIGGPVATAGGVLFIAATMDQYLRAFDMRSGDELWRHALPAGSQATPMTYTADGRQYVVMATGGHLWLQTDPGDTIIAFALPDDP